MSMARLERTQTELAAFLRTKRSALSPDGLGLPATGRRRTPGLRREEVAALAGVGLTWYSWLEQGRDITVSAHVLDRVAEALRLSDVERRHLFLLAHKRPPADPATTTRHVPDLARRLLDDLTTRPAYLFNLRWDVVAWNRAAQAVFGFEQREAGERNMLWMLFADGRLSGRIGAWAEQAPLFVASFRRDFAQAPDGAMLELVAALEATSAEFRALWNSQNVHGSCRGRRTIEVEGIGPVAFDHATLVVSAEAHLRLAFYAAAAGDANGEAFDHAAGGHRPGRG